MQNVLDALESWLDEHYESLVFQFRNGDSVAGTKAIATMDVRIKLAQLIESSLQSDPGNSGRKSLAGVAENNHGTGSSLGAAVGVCDS